MFPGCSTARCGGSKWVLELQKRFFRRNNASWASIHFSFSFINLRFSDFSSSTLCPAACRIGAPSKVKLESFMIFMPGAAVLKSWSTWSKVGISGLVKYSSHFPGLTWRPREFEAAVMLSWSCSTVCGSPARQPSSRYQILVSDLQLLDKSSIPRAKRKGPNGSPCCTPSFD